MYCIFDLLFFILMVFALRCLLCINYNFCIVLSIRVYVTFSYLYTYLYLQFSENTGFVRR